MVVTFSSGRRRRSDEEYQPSLKGHGPDALFGHGVVATMMLVLLRCSPRTKPKVTEVRIFTNSIPGQWER